MNDLNYTPPPPADPRPMLSRGDAARLEMRAMSDSAAAARSTGGPAAAIRAVLDASEPPGAPGGGKLHRMTFGIEQLLARAKFDVRDFLLDDSRLGSAESAALMGGALLIFTSPAKAWVAMNAEPDLAAFHREAFTHSMGLDKKEATAQMRYVIREAAEWFELLPFVEAALARLEAVPPPEEEGEAREAAEPDGSSPSSTGS